MNTAHHGRAQDDADGDPTGMRDVLASLPDPGPMPDSVAARIQQSLQDERAYAAQHNWTGGADVADLTAERQRRRAGQWIMAAAAVVAVGVIGTVVFDQVLGSSSSSSDAAAQYAPTQNEAGSGSESDADAQGGSEEGGSPEGDAGAEAAADDRVNADSGGEDSAGVDSGDSDSAEPEALENSASRIQDIDDDAFATGALLLLQDNDAPLSGLPVEFSGSPGAQPLPAQEVDSCVQAVGEDPGNGEWAAAPATINGSDVVVLGDLTPQQSRAWAVEQGCIADDGAAILTGPVDLP